MIGLISAMEEEVLLFKKHLRIAKTVRHAMIDFYVGSLNGRKVVLAKSGIGKVNAAVAAQILVDRFDVRGVIVSGLAGSLVPIRLFQKCWRECDCKPIREVLAASNSSSPETLFSRIRIKTILG